MLFTDETRAEEPLTPPRVPALMPTQEIAVVTFGGALKYAAAIFLTLFELGVRASESYRAD
jgi:hypothetical protein